MTVDISETLNKVRKVQELSVFINTLSKEVKKELTEIRLNKIQEIYVEKEKYYALSKELEKKYKSSSETLTTEEKSLLKEEILKLNQYNDYYLNSLLVAICELFGHDIDRCKDGDYCKCCNYYISSNIEERTRYKYDVVFDNYNVTRDVIIIGDLSCPSVLKLPVMTFEEFKELTEEQVQSLFKQLDIEEISRKIAAEKKAYNSWLESQERQRIAKQETKRWEDRSLARRLRGY